MDLKVLILDDEYIILDGLCSFPWETYGCCVVGSAEDGAEGLELAAKHHPDIILSDIKMPGMNGLEFSEQVKKDNPDTEIILLTGYDIFSIFCPRRIFIPAKSCGTHWASRHIFS